MQLGVPHYEGILQEQREQLFFFEEILPIPYAKD